MGRGEQNRARVSVLQDEDVLEASLITMRVYLARLTRNVKKWLRWHSKLFLFEIVI